MRLIARYGAAVLLGYALAFRATGLPVLPTSASVRQVTEFSAWLLLPRSCLVNFKSAAFQFSAIHRLDGRPSVLGPLEGHETEATRLSGDTVHRDMTVDNGPVPCKYLSQLLLGNCEWQVADVET